MSTMTSPRRWTRKALFIAVLAVAVLMFLRADVARTQTASVKVAAANMEKIFDQIQEKKDFLDKMSKDFNDLKTEQQNRANAVKELQTQRDLFKPETPQYIDADNKLLQASLEFDNWSRFQSAKFDRARKREYITLYDKITKAVGAVAKSKGIDIVIADVQTKLPDPQQLDQMTEAQLLQGLSLRNVLYRADTADISPAVIAQMDADYKAGK